MKKPFSTGFTKTFLATFGKKTTKPTSAELFLQNIGVLHV